MGRRRKGSLSRTVFGTVFIVIGIVVCTTTSIFAVDSYCRADINKWMPIYPEAELVETLEEGFFRPRASGITQQVYYTPDTPNDVRAWYRTYRRDLTSGNFNEANANAALSGVASTDYRISDDPDSDGTFISFYSECAYN
ncbi:MAG: hypothetical protein WBC91_11725 [Phototrophicaceae bacterium]